MKWRQVDWGLIALIAFAVALVGTLVTVTAFSAVRDARCDDSCFPRLGRVIGSDCFCATEDSWERVEKR